ncbi:TPA: hypothetical protein ACPZBZ_004810 [Enterobacter hormaechei subsp. steigerwaltii]
MSHNPYTVEFPDGTRLYGVNNGACSLRLLFDTPEQAMNFPREELYSAVEPANVRLTEVTVVLDPGEPWEEINRASFEERWLTGPANSDERNAGQPIDADLYGNFD